jgi:hypothetical protein
MKLYIASASCDWGFIYRDRSIKASSFATAFQRAGKLAQKEARKRPKEIAVKVRLVGTESRISNLAAQATNEYATQN